MPVFIGIYKYIYKKCGILIKKNEPEAAYCINFKLTA